MLRRKLFLVTAALFAATLWGCGSDMGSGGGLPPSGGLEDAARVGSASCKVCHTAVVAQGFNGSAHDDVATGCEGCHGGGQFHRGIGPIPYPSPDLAQCAQCHDVSRHGSDLTTTVDVIEGFAVTACEDCHYPANLNPAVTTQWAHNPAIDINQQWANSAHGGHIASGPATKTTAPGWTYYNWDQVTGTGNRATCQRCHTATGAKNFFDAKIAGTAYVETSNTFPHLEGWTAAAGSPQNEMLYCWGCHSDVPTGTLRDPGAIVEIFAGVGTAAPAATVTFPNVFESNICLGCHIGRQVGQNIADSTADFSNRNFINSHYLAAGGTVFNKAGYEYGPTANYSIYGFHKQVGWSDVQSTGTRGPCVTCHMTSAEGHTFEVVQKDGAGVITAVASTACVSCHADMNPATLNATKIDFEAALEELRVALASRGVHFYEAHPYFFTAPYVPNAPAGTNVGVTNWNGINVGTEATPITGRGKDVMGAAFNYNLLAHDPGAYAHNSGYALKLIVDSLDFLVDGTVNADATTRASAAFVLLNQGINIFDSPDYAAIHNVPVAAALADYANASTTCSACHSRAPHFTTTTSGQGSAQYVNPNGSCADCHAGNDIAANADILNQYSQAGHANNNGASWRGNTTVGCGRCHDPVMFANSTFGTTFVPSDTKKVLACIACHSDVADGTVRMNNPQGDYSVAYTVNTITVNLDYVNYGASSLCVVCHSGDGRSYPLGSQISATTWTTNVGHNLFAGATLVGKSGYTFTGEQYPSESVHQAIGLGDDGPCVSCHMSGSAGHTWRAVTKDQAGNITAINSSACISCHDGVALPAMAVQDLEDSRLAFGGVLDALRAALAAKGIHYNQANGNFFQESTFSTQVDFTYLNGIASTQYSGQVRDLMGAMHNLRLYSYAPKDPGGYVHNWKYVLTLIAHSIDFVGDGLINGTPNVAYNLLPPAT
jgi:nitrate/TMAO reductase-like tetraheme cytochrome c subunit